MTERAHSLPWIEKHRPDSFADIMLNDRLKEHLRRIVATRQVPNMIFTGATGVGKTSAARLITRELFRGIMSPAVVHELDSTHDRNAKTTIAEVRSFCAAPFVADWKLVVFDESDSISDKTQLELLRLMNEHCSDPRGGVRFIFICNSSEAIIESIQSNCLIIRFAQLDTNQMVRRLRDVCANEKVKVDTEGLKQIANMANGDLRAAINILQLVAKQSGVVTVRAINEACDNPSHDAITAMIRAAVNDDMSSAICSMRDLLQQGYSGGDILNGMMLWVRTYDTTRDDAEVNGYELVAIARAISETQFVISSCLDSRLQMMACLELIRCGIFGLGESEL